MKKSTLTNLILILIFLLGLSLLLYPTVSDYWNSMHQSQAIASYVDTISTMDNEQYEAFWEAAKEYNQSLLTRSNTYVLTEEQKQSYNTLLNISDTGVMGYVEIPSIACSLPIYHGTDEAALQVAIGHLEWTSLPTGGESTHCVLSGHRGLPSAKLFTDLDKVREGDIFMLRILDQVLTYEVDQILIVEPTQTDALLISEGKDHCTLVTCTPYGVNSHRLLVRGHRIANIEEASVAYVTADAIQIEPLIVAPIVATPILLLLFFALMLQDSKPKKKPRR